MTQIDAKNAYQSIFTSYNPRTEDTDKIVSDMTDRLNEDVHNYKVIMDRSKAITDAINMAEKDDVILIAGKGHETYQQIGHTKYDFDDYKVAEEAIRNKGR